MKRWMNESDGCPFLNSSPIPISPSHSLFYSISPSPSLPLSFHFSPPSPPPPPLLTPTFLPPVSPLSLSQLASEAKSGSAEGRHVDLPSPARVAQESLLLLFGPSEHNHSTRGGSTGRALVHIHIYTLLCPLTQLSLPLTYILSYPLTHALSHHLSPLITSSISHRLLLIVSLSISQVLPLGHLPAWATTTTCPPSPPPSNTSENSGMTLTHHPSLPSLVITMITYPNCHLSTLFPTATTPTHPHFQQYTQSTHFLTTTTTPTHPHTLSFNNAGRCGRLPRIPTSSLSRERC